MAEYIERETAIDAVKQNVPYAYHAVAITLASMIPAADVKPVVRGEWIWDDEGYHCSECFFHAYGNTGEILSGAYHYCPNCGADMRQTDEEA